MNEERVWVLMIQHKHGNTTSVFRELLTLEEELYKWVKEYWHEVEEALGSYIPDDMEAVDKYFEEHQNEDYTYDEVLLQ